jgi:hypothetical protein
MADRVRLMALLHDSMMMMMTKPTPAHRPVPARWQRPTAIHFLLPLTRVRTAFF